MSLDTLEKPLKTSAAGQYLGYAIQPVRFCFKLLSVADGDGVALEYLDDVSTHHSDGRLTLEQCKSSISGKGLADKSVDLWKTFSNWADICAARSIDPEATSFVLYLTPGGAGELALELAGATTGEAALTILAKLKKWLTPSAAVKGFAPYLANFLQQGDSRCASMIRNFSLIAEVDPADGIEQLLRATIPEVSVKDFASASVGMAKELAERQMRDGGDVIVDAKSFRRRFQAFVRKHNLAGLLNPTTGVPDPVAIQSTITSSPTYVRQLSAVAMNPEVIVGAVSACLRTTADKINWAAEGLIVEESLTDFDTSLESRFLLVRDEVEDLHASTSAEQRGRLTYRRGASIQLPLEGRSLPEHFVQGAFNILADDVRIGWHPSFADLFGKG